MPEKVKIKLIGNSAAVFLNKGSLKVYGLKPGDDLSIDYKFPRIILKKWEEDDEERERSKSNVATAHPAAELPGHARAVAL